MGFFSLSLHFSVSSVSTIEHDTAHFMLKLFTRTTGLLTGFGHRPLLKCLMRLPNINVCCEDKWMNEWSKGSYFLASW